MKVRLIGLLLGIIFIVITFLVRTRKISKKWKQKSKELQSKRINRKKSDFINHFLLVGYSESSINFIYDKVQDYLGEIKFVLLPEDDFLLTYEIEKEEIIYPILDWLKEYQLRSYSKDEIETLIKNQRIIDFKFLIGLFN